MSSDRDQHVMRMLAQGACAGGTDFSSLTSLRSRIDGFMQSAALAPAPQPIETADGSSVHDPNSDATDEIHLNLVLGVFEDRSADRERLRRSLPQHSGVILPSAAAEDMLAAERMRDSEAVIGMLNALGDRSGGTGSLDKRARRREEDSAASDESDVCYMDADELSDTSSDDDSVRPPSNQKRLIEEC